MIANSEEDQMEVSDNFSDSKILLKSNLSNADKLEIISNFDSLKSQPSFQFPTKIEYQKHQAFQPQYLQKYS